MAENVNYSAFYKKLLSNVENKSREAVVHTLGRTWADFFSVGEERIKEMFNKVIEEFYSSYKPKLYIRNESLYDILKTTQGVDYLEIGFSPADMTPFRSGYFGDDGLYDQVFRKGWHGGSASGTGHPNPGRPYLRKPVPYYSEWGSPAAIASEAPLDNMKRHISEYIRYGQQEDFKRSWKACVKNMKPSYQQET